MVSSPQSFSKKLSEISRISVLPNKCCWCPDELLECYLNTVKKETIQFLRRRVEWRIVDADFERSSTEQ